MPPVTTTLELSASLPYRIPSSSTVVEPRATNASLAPATAFNSSQEPSPLSRIIAIGIGCIGALVVALGVAIVISAYVRKQRRQPVWDNFNAGAQKGVIGEPRSATTGNAKPAPRLKPLSFLQGREGPKEWVPGNGKSKRGNVPRSSKSRVSLRKSLLSALSRKSTMIHRSGTIKSSSVGHGNDVSVRDSPSMERLDPASVNDHHHAAMNLAASRRPTQATVESFEMTQRPLSIPVSTSLLNLPVPTQTQTRNASVISLNANGFRAPDIEPPRPVHGPNPISPSVPSPSVYSQSHEGDPGRASPTRIIGVSKRPSLAPIADSSTLLSTSLAVPRAGSPSRQPSHTTTPSSNVQWRTDIWSQPSSLTAPTTTTTVPLGQTRRPSAANAPSSFGRYSRMGSTASGDGSTELPYRAEDAQHHLDRTPAVSTARRPSNASISGFTAMRRPSSASYKNHQWI